MKVLQREMLGLKPTEKGTISADAIRLDSRNQRLLCLPSAQSIFGRSHLGSLATVQNLDNSAWILAVLTPEQSTRDIRAPINPSNPERCQK